MLGMQIYTDAYPIREPIDQAEVFHEKTHWFGVADKGR
jgi:hypothetical protein